MSAGGNGVRPHGSNSGTGTNSSGASDKLSQFGNTASRKIAAHSHRQKVAEQLSTTIIRTTMIRSFAAPLLVATTTTEPAPKSTTTRLRRWIANRDPRRGHHRVGTPADLEESRWQRCPLALGDDRDRFRTTTRTRHTHTQTGRWARTELQPGMLGLRHNYDGNRRRNFSLVTRAVAGWLAEHRSLPIGCVQSP